MNKIIKDLVNTTIEDARIEVFQLMTLPSVKKYTHFKLISIDDLKRTIIIPMKKRKNRKVKMEDNPLITIDA